MLYTAISNSKSVLELNTVALIYTIFGMAGKEIQIKNFDIKQLSIFSSFHNQTKPFDN